MPFGEIVKKYDLGPAVRTLYNYAQGFGAFLDQLTIYVYKNIAPSTLETVLNGTWLTARDNNNQELYAKAHQWLGNSNVLVNSSVIAASRPLDITSSNASNDTTAQRTELLVSTPYGLKLIRAKTVLFTAPPILRNLEGWDLDEKSTLSSPNYPTVHFTSASSTTLVSRPPIPSSKPHKQTPHTTSPLSPDCTTLNPQRVFLPPFRSSTEVLSRFRRVESKTTSWHPSRSCHATRRAWGILISSFSGTIPLTTRSWTRRLSPMDTMCD